MLYGSIHMWNEMFYSFNLLFYCLLSWIMVLTPWLWIKAVCKVITGLPMVLSLHCTVAKETWWISVWHLNAQTESLTLYTSSWHVMGSAWSLAAGMGTRMGRKDVGKPEARTVRQPRHMGPDPGVALLSPFISLFCELLSFFPWRKDTLSNLAECENLTHTCLLWLWHPARGKGQSP